MKRVLALILGLIFILAASLPASALTTVAVKGIKLDKTAITLQVGKTYQLKATLTPADTTQKSLTYATSNKNTVAVDASGIITAVGAGSATITVYTTDNTIYAKCEVTVQLPPKVKLRFAHNWTGTDPKTPVMNDFVAQFEKKYPYIDLQVETTPGMDHQTKIQTDIAANNAPDVFNFWTGTFLQPLVQAGKLADLTHLINTDSDFRKGRYLSNSFDLATFNGKIYGIPSETSFDALFVNNAILKKYGLSLPKTFNDLKNICGVLVSNGIVPIAQGDKDGAGTELVKGMIFKAGGNDYINSLLKQGDYSPLIIALTHLQELVRLGAFPKDVNALSQDEELAMFNNQKAAMFFDGSWYIGSIKPEVAPNIEVIPFPAFSDGKADQSSTIGGTSMYWVMSASSYANSAKKDAMLTLLRNLIDDSVYKNMAVKASIPSAKKLTIGAGELSNVMEKALAMQSQCRAIIPNLYNQIPGALRTQLKAKDQQQQYEALETPQGFVDTFKTGLGK